MATKLIFGANVGYLYKKPEVPTMPQFVEETPKVVETLVEPEPIAEKPKNGWKSKREKKKLPYGLKEQTE
jgi:hypothetical protein